MIKGNRLSLPWWGWRGEVWIKGRGKHARAVDVGTLSTWNLIINSTENQCWDWSNCTAAGRVFALDMADWHSNLGIRFGPPSIAGVMAECGDRRNSWELLSVVLQQQQKQQQQIENKNA